MRIALPLETMTINEKIEVLERIWDDLCADPERVPSPDWHAEILRSREEQVQKGEAGFTDWPEAREQIRKSLK